MSLNVLTTLHQKQLHSGFAQPITILQNFPLEIRIKEVDSFKQFPLVLIWRLQWLPITRSEPSSSKELDKVWVFFFSTLMKFNPFKLL